MTSLLVWLSASKLTTRESSTPTTIWKSQSGILMISFSGSSKLSGGLTILLLALNLSAWRKTTQRLAASSRLWPSTSPMLSLRLWETISTKGSRRLSSNAMSSLWDSTKASMTMLVKAVEMMVSSLLILGSGPPLAIGNSLSLFLRVAASENLPLPTSSQMRWWSILRMRSAETGSSERY